MASTRRGRHLEKDIYFKMSSIQNSAHFTFTTNLTASSANAEPARGSSPSPPVSVCWTVPSCAGNETFQCLQKCCGSSSLTLCKTISVCAEEKAPGSLCPIQGQQRCILALTSSSPVQASSAGGVCLRACYPLPHKDSEISKLFHLIQAPSTSTEL